jgi:hypothetical protein
MVIFSRATFISRNAWTVTRAFGFIATPQSLECGDSSPL